MVIVILWHSLCHQMTWMRNCLWIQIAMHLMVTCLSHDFYSITSGSVLNVPNEKLHLNLSFNESQVLKYNFPYIRYNYEELNYLTNWASCVLQIVANYSFVNVDVVVLKSLPLVMQRF